MPDAADTRFAPVLSASFTTRDGVQLRHGTFGAPDGLPVLFLHGYTDSAFSFSRLIPLLPPDLHGILVDQRGHGDSGKPDVAYTRRAFAWDALDLLDHLRIDRPVVVVGHSLGTFIAQRLAAERPERVSALFLIGAAASAAKNSALLDLLAEIDALSEAPGRAFIRAFQESTAAEPLPPVFLDRVIEESAKLPLVVWRRALADLVNPTQDVARGTLGQPARILWGDRDGVFSREDQAAVLRALSRAHLTVLTGVGHAPHWEQPEIVARELVRFLDDPYADPAA